MTAGGRGQPEATSTLDAYVDGQLAGPARAAFEARLARDPALAAELDLQRQLDGSLRALFVATPFPGVPTNGHPTPLPNNPAAPAIRKLSRRLAVAAVLLLAVGAAASWLAYSALADRRRSFAEVYREQFLTGAAPSPKTAATTQANAAAATTAFESACYRSFGRTLQLTKSPAGLELEGVGEAPVLSAHTIMLRARVDGNGVLVFVDRAANDDGGVAARSAAGCGGGCCGVHVFRRQLQDLVLYEMTPLDEPSIIEAFDFPPTPPTSCGGGDLDEI